MNAKLGKNKPVWSSVFLIALGSAFFLTVEKVVDSVISNNYAIANDPITASSAYLFVGGWFGVLVCFVLGKTIGKNIPGHSGIRLPKAYPLRLSIFAGISAGLSTFIFLWGNQYFDLSVMVGISNFYILMIVIYEWLSGKVTIQKFLLPGIVAVIGTIMVAYNPAWVNDNILQDQIGKLIFIFFSFNILVAFDRLITKPAVDQSDPINVQIVRFTLLAITGTITAFTLAFIRNEYTAFIDASKNILMTPAVYVWLFILFAAVFLGQVLELWAKRKNVDVSSVVIVIGLQVGLGFVATLVIDSISPGFVGNVPAELFTRAVRLIGVASLVLAIALLQKKDAKPSETVSSKEIAESEISTEIK